MKLILHTPHDRPVPYQWISQILLDEMSSRDAVFDPSREAKCGGVSLCTPPPRAQFMKDEGSNRHRVLGTEHERLDKI